MQAGLVLALLGGVRKCVGASDAVPVRGDIHVLICGDPGLGKSQLLQVSCMNFILRHNLKLCCKSRGRRPCCMADMPLLLEVQICTSSVCISVMDLC